MIHRSAAGLGLLTLALLVLPVMGQSKEATHYAAKESAAFVGKVSCVREFVKAKATAAEKDTVIFGYFTRSYAP